MRAWHYTRTGTAAYDNRIRYCCCPRFAVSCSDQLLKEVARISARENIPVYTHASENRSEIRLVEEQRGMPTVVILTAWHSPVPTAILAHGIPQNDTGM